MVDVCEWMAWSGLLVLVVRCVSFLYYLGVVLLFCFFALHCNSGGFGIHREYEDSNSDLVDIM